MSTIAYILRNLPLERYKNTISESIVVSFLLGIYNFSPYYSDFLTESSKTILSIIGLFYICYVWTKILITKEQNHLKYYLIYDIGSNIIAKYFPRSKGITIQKIVPASEVNRLLFLFVKIFYIPVMLNFTINNFDEITRLFGIYQEVHLSNLTLYNWYGIIIALFFFIDTSYFLFGYLIESKKLGSTIRTVDKSIISWIVTLACYPPFNNIASEYFPWVAHESNLMFPNLTNYILLSSLVIFFGIYLSATLALGSKCSNLTNRGTVCRGPYKYVRHPAYAAKLMAWWLMSLPIMNPLVFFSMTMWTAIYVIRALKEEDHLLSDNDYKKYYSATPYRFIPKIF